jgi:hypothetical protein
LPHSGYFIHCTWLFSAGGTARGAVEGFQEFPSLVEEDSRRVDFSGGESWESWAKSEEEGRKSEIAASQRRLWRVAHFFGRKCDAHQVSTLCGSQEVLLERTELEIIDEDIIKETSFYDCGSCGRDPVGSWGFEASSFS